MTEQPHLDQDPTGSEPTYKAAAELAAALADTPPMPDDERRDVQSAPETEEAAQELRTAQTGWLERRGVLEDTPHLTMTRREFELLRDVGLGDGGEGTSRLVDQTKQMYGIPPEAEYVAVEVVPDDASQPHTTQLVTVGKEDFGTVVDAGRLEGHDTKPEDILRITMTKRELGLFSIAGLNDGSPSFLIKHAKDVCGISEDKEDKQNDQYAPQYALVDVVSDGPDRSTEPVLVTLSEQDFGTIIDREILGKDNAYLNHDPDIDPDSPRTPGTYNTVDIGHTLTDSYYDLKDVASGLVGGRTESPLSGKFWLRAGGVGPNQKDAYVWEGATSLTKAVDLTVAFPGQYNSVSAVVGDRKDAGNGKAGMAQIVAREGEDHVAVVFTIEGENLKQLQDVYRNLYHEPDYALTAEQRSRRDETFNSLVGFMVAAAGENQTRKSDEERRRYEDSQPRYRYIDRP
jgi:hypothetical protein